MRNAARTPARRRRHPLATFVVLFIALVGVGAAYAAVSGLSSGTAQAAGSATPQQIERGRQLFLEGCSSCHGLAAQGTSNGPTLIGVGAAAVDFQVGTGRMPAAQFGAQIQATKVTYTQDEIDALAGYVASLAPGPAIPTADQLNYQDANLQQGGALFRTNCAQCHNFAGKGGALTQGKFAPPLTGASAKQMYEAMVTGPQSMPVFANTTLPQDEKLAIIKYVKAIQGEPNPGGASLGRIGPVSEGLLLWVLGLGAVTAVAVWIGAKAS